MEFCILGPLEASRDGDRLALGGPKQRALLAILLLNADRVVSRDRLIEELWPDKPPAAAGRALEVHVSRLRKALGVDGGESSVLVTRAPGYVLHVEPGALDLRHFERLVGEGRRALRDDDPSGAARALREAEHLWRGRPLADLEFEPFARVDIERLEELRLDATEDRIDAELALGRHAELVAELETLVAEHPLRERARGQLMLALYRAGRQADALEVYRQGRDRLVDELALEPSPTVQHLQRAILAHSAELAPPPTRQTPPAHGRLPVPPNRTIGRDDELQEIGQRLRSPSVRLLTLTGPGGVGKTRLALEAARGVQADFADGGRFVSLAALRGADDVPAALVADLGIVALAGESADQAAGRFLAAKRLLLVADNVEHLLPGAATFLAGLLESCLALTVLATSREPLGIHAEERYPVAPLALPAVETSETPKTLAGRAAVVLFCERARARDPDFILEHANAAAVAEICRRVDGLPLAIELAAGRCGLLSPGEIAERLDDAPGVLGTGARDASARQQTLRATIEWSHELLGDAEKACFARFAVFAGGATIEAAQTITGADLDLLDGLVAKSLLGRRHESPERTRLGMLETIHAYAIERFAAAADEQAVHECHHRYYLELACSHGSQRALWGANAKDHLARLDDEVPNLHAALDWAVERDRAEAALELCVALGPYWLMRSRYADALERIDRTLSVPGADANPALRARALCQKTWCVWALGRGDELHAVMNEAEAAARDPASPGLLSYVLRTRATHELSDHPEAAATLAEEALHWASVAGDDWAFTMAAETRALASARPAELRHRVKWAATLLQQAGNLYILTDLLVSAAYAALCHRSDRDAHEFVARALPHVRELDNPTSWVFLQGTLGIAKLVAADADGARDAFDEQLRLCRELRILPLVSEGLLGLAAVAAVRSDPHRAARLVGAARAHRYGIQQDEVTARLHTTFLDPARTRHGTDSWDAAVRDGTTLSFDDAVAYALEESCVDDTHVAKPKRTSLHTW